jgi:hypothetical protein
MGTLEHDGFGKFIKVEDTILGGSTMAMVDVVVGLLAAVPVAKVSIFGSGSVATVEDTIAFANEAGALATS